MVQLEHTIPKMKDLIIFIIFIVLLYINTELAGIFLLFSALSELKWNY